MAKKRMFTEEHVKEHAKMVAIERLGEMMKQTITVLEGTFGFDGEAIGVFIHNLNQSVEEKYNPEQVYSTAKIDPAAVTKDVL